MVCHYCFLNYVFKFQDFICNGCHHMTMLSVNISDIAIISIKNVDYCWIIQKISKYEVINVLESSMLEDWGACI